MGLSVSTNSKAIQGVVGLMMARKTMDIALDQNSQLLESVPKAPGPSHLGQGVDMFI